ncbi:MAG TPA: HAD family hydrolase [Candidatus Acidoferrum sp.]|nr:HAD family hydrolase [Candidatus Acidoferrum sp.]
MDKLHPTAVLFDLGSTLIDYPSTNWDKVNARCAVAARRFLEENGFALPPEGEFGRAFEVAKEKYRRHAYETLIEWEIPQVAIDILRQLQIPIGDGLIDRFFDAYYQPVGEIVFVYPDAKDILKRIRESGRRIGLISNTVFPERTHREELVRFGIEPFLDFAIFSSTYGLRKPHPSIYLEAARLAGCRADQCVYIGDRFLEDVLGPGNVGMPAILKELAGREYPPRIENRVRRIKVLSELPQHIDI